jgi:opacity protein-like surface antigen
LKTVVLFAAVLACSCTSAFSQARATASRTGDLQIGLGYTSADSDYTLNRIRGLAFYTDFDFKPNFGVELEFHQLNDPQSTKVYERTYEVGGRYVRHYNRLNPYIKLMYGRGVFNFPQDQANLAYNLWAGGGGIDYAVMSRVNVRADFQYQRWLSFPPTGLAPTLFTVGAAYHFPAGKPRP